MEKTGKNKNKHLEFLIHYILGHPQGTNKILRSWLSKHQGLQVVLCITGLAFKVTLIAAVTLNIL